MRTWTLVLLLAAAIPFLGGCGKNPFAGKNVVGSPVGSVYPGTKAYSLDGKYYLTELEPYKEGLIAVKSVSDDKEVQRWDVLKDCQNDVKGLAFSNDSTRVAVMYHGGTSPGICIYEIGKKSMVAMAETSKWYHFLAFTDKPDEMVASTDGNGQEKVVVTTLPEVAEVASEPSVSTPTTPVSPGGPKTPVVETVPADVSPFSFRDDAVFSSQGDVPPGEKANSPDGKYYACEIKPYGYGHIAIYKTKDNKLVQKWQVLPNDNSLKGLAWSPNSKRVAIMYHGGMTEGIQVVEIGKTGVVAAANIDQWFHFMVYDKAGKALLLAESRDANITKIVPKEVGR